MGCNYSCVAGTELLLLTAVILSAFELLYDPMARNNSLWLKKASYIQHPSARQADCEPGNRTQSHIYYTSAATLLQIFFKPHFCSSNTGLHTGLKCGQMQYSGYRLLSACLRSIETSTIWKHWLVQDKQFCNN